MLRRILSGLYHDSPKTNLTRLRDRLAGKEAPPPKAAPQNKVLDGILSAPYLANLLVVACGQGSVPLVFAGPEAAHQTAVDRLKKLGREITSVPWNWGDDVPAEGHVVLCRLPVEEAEWNAVAAMKKKRGGRVILLTELLLPFTRITFLQGKLDYFLKDFAKLLPYYTGEKYFGPLDKLNALFPVEGKTVIEFGPFDGCQTAGLVHLGAAGVTCIEARAENATKTLAAVDVFGWRNVKLVMDDFHNADASKYGSFDMAFAHGVYYHSVAPFVFLENLVTLSDRIFIGGFCATDTLPASPWVELTHEGRPYRAKRYREAGHFTAGVNRHAWFFHGDDLLRFFTERGWRTEIVSDETTTVTAGRYLRFLATRSAAGGATESKDGDL